MYIWNSVVYQADIHGLVTTSWPTEIEPELATRPGEAL